MGEAGDGWSMEQTGHGNIRATPGALSPPPLSSRWDRKPHFSELAAGYNGMLIHRTASSSSRSCRSNSIGSESRTTASHHRCETADGLLAVFNSPSESFHYSQRSLGHVTDSATIPAEQVWKKSAAHPSQEESRVFSKAIAESESVYMSNHVQNFSKFDLLAASQNAESSFNLMVEGGHAHEGSSAGLHFYQQMLRNSVDVPLSIPRQKSASWRTRGFSELVDATRPRSSRWSNMGIPLNILPDGEQEDFYIRSTAMMHSHDSSSTPPQVESPKCGLCTKGISHKSRWSFSRALGSKDLPVVGILECGHVYHAECLDQATPMTHAHDPPCPMCEDKKRALAKVHEGSLSKSRTKERTYIKGKISRVGVSVEELDEAQRMRYPSGLSESSSRKGASHIAHNADKSFSTKSLLRKQFSFRGKAGREVTGGNGFGSKRPGYAARVSPENSIREDDLFNGQRAF